MISPLVNIALPNFRSHQHVSANSISLFPRLCIKRSKAAASRKKGMAAIAEELRKRGAGADEWVEAARQVSETGDCKSTAQLLHSGCNLLLDNTHDVEEASSSRSRAILAGATALQAGRDAAQQRDRATAASHGNRAALLLNNAANAAPQEAAPQVTRAALALGRQSTAEALRALEPASERRDGAAETVVWHLGFAAARANRNEHVLAVRELERALKRCPDGPSSIRTALGACHLRIGQLNTARACFERALELNSSDADAHIGLALVERASAHPNPSSSTVQKQAENTLAAYNSDSNHFGASLLMAEHAAIAGQQDDVATLAAAAYLRAPTPEARAEACLHVARCSHVHGKLHDARRWYLAALKEDGKVASARAGAAQCMLARNETRAAVEQLERALDTVPGDPLCMQLLGHCLTGIDDGRATRLLEQAASARGGPPKPLECWMELGCLQTSQQPRRALEAYENALALVEPGSARYLGLAANAAALASQLGDTQRARQWHSRALKAAGLEVAGCLAESPPDDEGGKKGKRGDDASTANILQGINITDSGVQRLLLNLAAFEGVSGNEKRQVVLLDAVRQAGGMQVVSEAALLRSSVAARRGAFDEALKFVEQSKPEQANASNGMATKVPRKAHESGDTEEKKELSNEAKELIHKDDNTATLTEAKQEQEKAKVDGEDAAGADGMHDLSQRAEKADVEADEAANAKVQAEFDAERATDANDTLNEGQIARKADAMALEGWIRMQQGDWRKAQDAFESLRECSSKHDEYATVGLGIISYETSVKPGVAAGGRTKSDVWRRERKALARARAYFQRALKASPSNVCAAQGAGAVLCELGRPADAAECLSEVEAALTAEGTYGSKKQLGEARVNLAHTHLAKATTKQELRRAAALYGTASSRVFNNKNAQVLQYRARAEYDASMLDEAKRSCLQAVHIAPEEIQLRHNAGLVLQKRSDHLLQSIAQHRSQLGSHVKDLEEALQELDKAKAAFEQLCDFDSETSFGIVREKTEELANQCENKKKKMQPVLERARQEAADRERERKAQENVVRMTEKKRAAEEEARRRQEERQRRAQEERAQKDLSKLGEERQKWRQREQAAQEKKEAKKRKASSVAATEAPETGVDEHEEQMAVDQQPHGPEEVVDVPLPNENEAGEKAKELQRQLGLAEDNEEEVDVHNENNNDAEVRDALGWRNREEERRRGALERLQEQRAKRQRTS